MNNLIKLENGQVKLDSRMIAEHFGKEHNDVLKDIRNEIEKLEEANIRGEGIFPLSSYKTVQNKILPCYTMGKRGALQLAARYDAVSRFKLIEKIDEIESQKRLTTPGSFAEALRLAAEQQERIELLQLETTQKDQIIGELKPKVDYLDMILNSKGVVTITQIAKDYGMSGSKLNKVLKDIGVQYLQHGQWLLYRKYHAEGYTHSETIHFNRTDGRPDTKMNTSWTQKGRLFLYELLKKHGHVPMIERF